VVELAQQQRAGVAGKLAAGEIGDDLARTEVLKEQRWVATICGRSGGGRVVLKLWFHSPSNTLAATLLKKRVKNPG
jgi:hypothetical protein